MRPAFCYLSPLFIALASASGSKAVAEIPDLSLADLQQSATQVITGKVIRIYSVVERTSSDWETTYRVAEIQVEGLETGEPIGSLAYVRFWRKQYVGNGLAPPGYYGHRGTPQPGDSVQIFVEKAADGGYDVLSPNGFGVRKRDGGDEP